MSKRTNTIAAAAFDMFTAGSNVDCYLETLSGAGEEGDRVMHVPLRELAAAPWQPRLSDPPEQLDHLVESIRRHGLLHPITVRPIVPAPDTPPTFRYEVIAGHRRLAALIRLAEGRGAEGSAVKAPVLVKHLDDLEARLLTHVENIDRSELCAWELARSFENVRAVLAAASKPHDVRSVAEHIGRSEGTTSEYLRIADAVTVDLLVAAGARDQHGRLDVSLVHRLQKGPLLQIAKASVDARQMMLCALVDKLRGGEPRMPARVAAQSASSDRSSGERRPPRFDFDQLRQQGGFKVNLTKPFAHYEPAEARRYLDDLLPAFAALGEVVAGEKRFILDTAGPGMVLYLRTGGAEVLPTRVQEALRHLLEEVSACALPPRHGMGGNATSSDGQEVSAGPGNA